MLLAVGIVAGQFGQVAGRLHPRGDVARFDDGDPDPEVPELVVQGLGQ